MTTNTKPTDLAPIFKKHGMSVFEENGITTNEAIVEFCSRCDAYITDQTDAWRNSYPLSAPTQAAAELLGVSI